MSLGKYQIKTEPNIKVEAEIQVEETPEETLVELVARLKSTREIPRFLKKIKEAYNLGDFPNKSRWIKEIDRLLTLETEGGNVFVGFVGVTGAGKSTTINALLKHNILPTAGTGSAVTAVPTFIMFNHNEEPGKEFRCVAKYISRKEVARIIEVLKKEVEEGDFNDETAEAQKFRLIFPDLQLEQLFDKTNRALLEDANNRFPLDGEEHINCETAAEFRTKIAPFISSQRAQGKWQVVKSVTLYVKSEFLKDGLSFVDFPGGGDINAARDNEAANALEKLSSLVILAPFDRGVDNKISRGFLNDAIGLRQQLTGQQAEFDSNGVIYAFTKCDDFSDTIDEYLEQQPDTLDKIPELHSMIAKRQRLLNEVKQVQLEEKNKKRNLSEAKKAFKKSQAKLNSMARRIGVSLPQVGNPDLGSAPEELCDSDRKKWNTLSKTWEDEGKNIREKTQERQNVGFNLSKTTKAQAEQDKCIKSKIVQYFIRENSEKLHTEIERNVSKGIATDKVRARAYKNSPMGSNLQIQRRIPSFHTVGISSHAYIAEGSASKDSGIPELQRKVHLIRAKAQTNRTASFGKGVELFLYEQRDWVHSPAFNDPIPDSIKEKMRQISDDLCVKHFDKIQDPTVPDARDRIKTYVHEDLAEELYSTFEKFAAKLPDMPENKQWNQIAFATFQAICVRQGEYTKIGKYDSATVSYHWPQDVYNEFQQDVFGALMFFFENMLPYQLEGLLIDAILKRLRKFGNDRSNEASIHYPPFQGRTSNLEMELPHIENRLRKVVSDLIKELRNTITQGLKICKEDFDQFIGDACLAARQVQPGHKKGERMKTEMKTFLRVNAEQVVMKIGQKFVDVIISATIELQLELGPRILAIINEVRTNFHETLEVASKAKSKASKEEVMVILHDIQRMKQNMEHEVAADPRFSDQEPVSAKINLEYEEDSEPEEGSRLDDGDSMSIDEEDLLP